MNDSEKDPDQDLSSPSYKDNSGRQSNPFAGANDIDLTDNNGVNDEKLTFEDFSSP